MLTREQKLAELGSGNDGLSETIYFPFIKKSYDKMTKKASLYFAIPYENIKLGADKWKNYPIKGSYIEVLPILHKNRLKYEEKIGEKIIASGTSNEFRVFNKTLKVQDPVNMMIYKDNKAQAGFNLDYYMQNVKKDAQIPSEFNTGNKKTTFQHVLYALILPEFVAGESEEIKEYFNAPKVVKIIFSGDSLMAFSAFKNTVGYNKELQAEAKERNAYALMLRSLKIGVEVKTNEDGQTFQSFVCTSGEFKPTDTQLLDAENTAFGISDYLKGRVSTPAAVAHESKPQLTSSEPPCFKEFRNDSECDKCLIATSCLEETKKLLT